MTSFRTELTPAPQSPRLGLGSRVLTAGSCFAEVMGRRLQEYKINTLVNPFGTIYNPVSLCRLLQLALRPDEPFNGELVERQGYWYAYDLHSSFAAASREELLARIREVKDRTHAFLQTTDTLLLTWGTAVAYMHRTSHRLVANCHKIPLREFDRQLLTIAQMESAWADLMADLKALRPDIRVILTVSPVRHLKETLELNAVSKSLLRVFCHEAANQSGQVRYFPAYELMLDDLRDYRFYKADMIHPTEVAEDYIWEKFKASNCDEAFLRFTTDWDKIRQALAHRPFQPDSAAHQQFLRKTLDQLQQFAPTIDCSAEIEEINKQLI